jgi:Family of unknown function (DUF6338)
MNFSADDIPMFLLFFIPGFISMKVYNLLVPAYKVNFIDKLFETLAYSGLNYIFFILAIFKFADDPEFEKEHPYIMIFAIMFIMAIMPVLWALFFYRLAKSNSFSKYIIYPATTAWQFTFVKKNSREKILVTFKNGTTKGGIFHKKSFGGKNAPNKDIFIEEEWQVEGARFIKPIHESKGVFISGDEIVTVEFYDEFYTG